MIKQVADALKRSFIERIEASASTPEKPMNFAETGVVLPGDDVWERYARAAIVELRIPTAVMCAAGANSGTIDDYNSMGQAYQAMIDEALK